MSVTRTGSDSIEIANDTGRIAFRDADDGIEITCKPEWCDPRVVTVSRDDLARAAWFLDVHPARP